MSGPNDRPGAFLALVEAAEWYAGGWIVGSALDQALSKQEPEPQVVFVPPPVEPDPAVEETLAEVEALQEQLREILSRTDALTTEPELQPEPPSKPSVPAPVRRGSVEELNAAVRAYNVAARRLGLVVLTGNLDDRAEGEPEDADDAIGGVIIAAEQLMRLGASLAWKADALASQRPDLAELTASSRAVEEKLPDLLDLAEQIDEL